MQKEETALTLHYELKNNCLVIYITDDLDHHAVGYLRERSLFPLACS